MGGCHQPAVIVDAFQFVFLSFIFSEGWGFSCFECRRRECTSSPITVHVPSPLAHKDMILNPRMTGAVPYSAMASAVSRFTPKRKAVSHRLSIKNTYYFVFALSKSKIMLVTSTSQVILKRLQAIKNNCPSIWFLNYSVDTRGISKTWSTLFFVLILLLQSISA